MNLTNLESISYIYLKKSEYKSISLFRILKNINLFESRFESIHASNEIGESLKNSSVEIFLSTLSLWRQFVKWRGGWDDAGWNGNSFNNLIESFSADF